MNKAMKRRVSTKPKDLDIDPNCSDEESEEQSCSSKKQRCENTLDFPPHVSTWKQREHLNILGLFYAEKPVDGLGMLLDKSLSYDTISHIQHLNPVLDPMVKLLKEITNFNANEFDPNSEEDTWLSDMEMIKKSHDQVLTATFDEVVSDFMAAVPQTVREISENKSTLERMLIHIWSGTLQFYNTLKYFMIETYRKKRKPEGCPKVVYTELLRDFFQACGLTSRSGKDSNKELSVWKYRIHSNPALRCSFENVMFRQLLGDVILTIGEVEKTQCNCRESESEDPLVKLESCNILGRHGGELLLEVNDTAFTGSHSWFGRLVYGTVVVGTQIIFTALEISDDQFEAMKTFNMKINDDTRRMGTIYYTRSYDILKCSDRNELYESLLRLACYQHQLKIVNS